MIRHSLDATTWDVEQVLSWAKEIGLEEDCINILKRERLDGEILLDLTFGIVQHTYNISVPNAIPDELISKPYSLPGAPAKKIITATKRLRPSMIF